VVAAGRAVLALFLVAAFLAGPTTEEMHSRAVGFLLSANIVWSLGLFAASRSRVAFYRLARLAPLTAAGDLIVFTLLLYLTNGADSPFFSPFIVLILGATIQWGSRGALVMGLLTAAAFLPAGWEVIFGRDGEGTDTQIFVVRLGYTTVVSIMLMSFGRHMERIVEELSRLSDPISEVQDEDGPPARECLRHALWVFGAGRGLFILEEMEEPFATAVWSEGDGFRTERLAPSEQPWVEARVEDTVFLFDPAGGETVLRSGGAVRRGPATPVADRLMQMATFERTLVIPVRAGGMRGWLMVFDHEDPANEDLAIGAMVGAQVSVALERWGSQRARRTAAAAEDRVRLARDLHDGVLQFLAGAGLQLDGLADAGLPEETRSRLAGLREAIADEQRELRGFISTLRPLGTRKPATERALLPELERLAGQLSRYWTIDVRVSVAPAGHQGSERTLYDLGRIVREAVANAVRHGEAREVRVTVSSDSDLLRIRIEDNGKGFAEPKPGTPPAIPWSLRERVEAMGGVLRLTSAGPGVVLDIDLPTGAFS
jgi:signal transduction histidine kinase